MKKYLLVILAILSFNFSNAQGFKFGLKGGGNYSNVAGSQAPKDSDYKFGYHMGVVALYEFDDMFGIKPEILYSTKGYQFDGTRTVGGVAKDVDDKLSLNYFTMPILLNVNAGGLFFELGPEIAYQAAVISEYKLEDGTKTETPLPKGEYAQFDIGYVAGLGYMLPMGLNFGIRYNGGLKSVYDSKDTEDFNMKNSNFQFSVGYMFGGGNGGSGGGGGETKTKTKIKSETE